MLNVLYSICKFLQDELGAAPYSFFGEIKIDHANYIDINSTLPKILVSDIMWEWTNEQYGSPGNKRVNPLYIEVFAGDKIHALRISTWIAGKELRGDAGQTGVLFNTNIPYLQFDASGTVVGTIGTIRFGNDPLPIIRFVAIVDTAELIISTLGYADNLLTA